MFRRPFQRVRGIILAPLALVLLLALAPLAMGQQDLDLKKAVKIGSGKIMVIEFTDPDCPYCRQAEAYFQNKPQVTRYIFFIPLPSHPASKGKVQYILSAKDKAKAYREAISNNFNPQKLAEITPGGVKLQKEHQEMARASNMKSTPSFMIYGRIIVGFDPSRLESLLK